MNLEEEKDIFTDVPPVPTDDTPDTVHPFIAIGILALLGGITTVLMFALYHKNISDSARSAAAVSQAEISLLADDPFTDDPLEARAVFVWDALQNKPLYAKNEQAQLPLASLIKLMTAIVASDIVPANTVVIITDEALRTEGNSGLLEREKWALTDLIEFTLLGSSNDGASALALTAGSFLSSDPNAPAKNKQAFVGRMNEKARELGLTQTYFLNETGLDENGVIGGGYGSARDYALLLEHIISQYPDLVDVTRYTTHTFHSLSDTIHPVENTNEVVGKIPGLSASKTGFTDLAGGNLVFSFAAGPGHPIIVSILGSTFDGRFRDAQKLVDTTLSLFVSENTH